MKFSKTKENPRKPSKTRYNSIKYIFFQIKMYLHQLFPHKETSQRRGSKKREKKLGKKKKKLGNIFHLASSGRGRWLGGWPARRQKKKKRKKLNQKKKRKENFFFFATRRRGTKKNRALKKATPDGSRFDFLSSLFPFVAVSLFLFWFLALWVFYWFIFLFFLVRLALAKLGKNPVTRDLRSWRNALKGR